MQHHQKQTYYEYLNDLENSSPHILETGCEGVMDNFNKDYAGWIIGIVKKMDKSYSRIGTLDLNDLLQEATLIFFKRWENIQWDRVEKANIDERQFVVWSFLKKTIRLELKKQIRNVKDGIRVPLYLYETNTIDGFLTRIFPNFFDGQFVTRDVSKFEQEVLSEFIETAMDKYLDRTFQGKRSKGIERNVISMLYGLDGIEKQTEAQVAKKYNLSRVRIRVIKHESLEKMKSEELSDWMTESFKECVATFMVSEEIATGSDAYDYYEKIIEKVRTNIEEIGN